MGGHSSDLTVSTFRYFDFYPASYIIVSLSDRRVSIPKLWFFIQQRHLGRLGRSIFKRNAIAQSLKRVVIRSTFSLCPKCFLYYVFRLRTLCLLATAIC